MSNKGTQEGQCQTGTADLAEAVFDCLSTGMKITVGFVFVVVFFSAISAIAAISSVSAGSAVSTGSAAPVGSGSLEVPEHSGPPGTSAPPQSTEVVLAVISGHSGEVPAGVGGVSIALNSVSGIAGHPGEVAVGGGAASIAIGSIPGTTGPAGEVPARDVPVPVVGGGIPPVVLPAGEVPVRDVPVPIVGGGIPPVVLPVGEVPAHVTSGGWHTSPPVVGGMHPPCSPCPHPPFHIHLWVSHLGPFGRRDHQHALTRLSEFLPFQGLSFSVLLWGVWKTSPLCVSLLSITQPIHSC